VPITKFAEKLHRGQDLTEDEWTDLFHHLFEEIRKYAAAQISPSVQSRVGPSTAASEAIQRGVKAVQQREDPPNDRQEFMRLLKEIVRCRVRDAVDAAQAKRRDVRRSVGTDALNDTAASNVQSLEILIRNEAFDLASEFMRTHLAEDYVFVGYLHYFEELDTSEILLRLQEDRAVNVSPSTVRRYRQRFELEIRKRFGEDVR
jgi:hypothetical protein